MAWKKCMGSKRPAKDWILGQQRQGRRQRQQEVEGCRFVHWMMNWCLWSAYQRLILSKDVTRGWGQQSSTVERHLQREFWMPCLRLTSGNHGSFWWRLVVICTCQKDHCNALVWSCWPGVHKLPLVAQILYVVPAIALEMISGCPLIECNWSLPSATNHYVAAIGSPSCLVLPGSLDSGVENFLGAIFITWHSASTGL